MGQAIAFCGLPSRGHTRADDKKRSSAPQLGSASHHMFVLKYLLGLDNVRNYDGSWTEWGNLVGAPVERGATLKAGA
jgi:hypothetical protein